MDKSVTISCRVTPAVKMEIAQRSEQLGMKLCNYIELLVLNNFEKERNGNSFNDAEELIEPTFQSLLTYLTDDTTQMEIFERYVSFLKEKYEDVGEIELVNACLIHAITNRNALWQRDLSVFIDRLKEGAYDN